MWPGEIDRALSVVERLAELGDAITELIEAFVVLVYGAFEIEARQQSGNGALGKPCSFAEIGNSSWSKR